MPTAELTTSLIDELLERPDRDHFEVVEGQLVECSMGSEAGWVANRFGSKLDQYAEAHGGWVFSESAGYRCFADDPERLRRPDISFVRADRLREPPRGFIDIPPDIAIEVVSPTDRYSEVEMKVAEYLDAGVKMVWLADPAVRRVRVFRPDQSTIELTARETLCGYDIAPGFECLVGSFFPPQPKPVTSGLR